MEPILAAEEHRLNLFPIRYDGAWQRYLTARAAFWVPGEIDFSSDLTHWKGLTDEERHYLSYVLAFFAQADGIVADNLVNRFAAEVQVREIQCFYDLQRTIENIHSETYSLLLETLIEDTDERNRLLHAVDHVESVAAKAKWAQTWLVSQENFATRPLAFAVVEGIFFSGSFASIFWIKQRGILPGLCMSNTLIARDEGMHQEFATYVFRELLETKLDKETVYALVGEAVDLEVQFITEALPCSMIGMNAESMTEYIRFVADRLLTEIQVPPLYGARNPFPFMELLGLEGKTNFFEARVPDYQRSGSRTDSSRYQFSLESDF